MSLVEDVAFDEMNIIETPFALLTNSSKITSIELSPEGHEYLGTTDKNGCLPNSLAEPTVLGLMWLSMRKNNFKTPTIRFSLRDLICNYVFPGRYNSRYTPSQKILKGIEQQINRVADTRIHTDRWFDRKLDKTTRMNAAIIDYVQVIDDGGKNKPRLLEIRWGEKFYKSVQDQYTKPIDPALFQRIEHPLDRRIYRWLDRQLALKSRQIVKSCQRFARYKLLMTGQKVDAGGRTASSYIIKRLKEALERLDSVGYSVRMVVDSSMDDFSIGFIKVAEDGPNEVLIEDKPGDLVREFQFRAHGTPLDSRKRRLPEADRMFAEQWIEIYGYEKSLWMVGRCVEIQKQTRAERILTFRGLGRYEQAASGDFDREAKKRAGQLELDIKEQLLEERKKKWEKYESEMIAHADEQLTEKQKSDLKLKAEKLVDNGGRIKFKEGHTRNILIKLELKKLTLEQVGAINKEEFFHLDDG